MTEMRNCHGKWNGRQNLLCLMWTLRVQEKITLQKEEREILRRQSQRKFLIISHRLIFPTNFFTWKGKKCHRQKGPGYHRVKWLIFFQKRFFGFFFLRNLSAWWILCRMGTLCQCSMTPMTEWQKRILQKRKMTTRVFFNCCTISNRAQN